MCDCGDGPSTYRETRPTARREHECCECRGVIKPGEVYRSLWGVWDGDAKTFKTCNDCLELQSWASDDADCFCPTLGNLHVDVLDFVHESGEPELIAEGERMVAAIRNNRRRQDRDSFDTASTKLFKSK